jgi:hypothetical protein
MSDNRFVLEGIEPRACSSPSAWHNWLESADRQIATTSIEHRGIVITINSQFLGVAATAGVNGQPYLFMTVVFGGPLGGKAWRGRSWSGTLRNHATAVREVIKALAVETERAG